MTVGQALRAGALATIIWRLVRGGRPRPPIRALEPSAVSGTVDDITVVVPARDEAGRIGPVLESIIGAPGVVEVIVVDDQSADATATVAADAGASVVRGGPRPPGWAGKTWALQQGVEAASTTWVVTLDADTRPDRSLPASLVARMRVDRADLLTVGGRFDCPTPSARWLHAAMLTTLVYRFGPPGPSRPQPPGRTLANGQCMAFRRDDLLAAGGFAPVAGSVVEDIALARHLAAVGWSVGFLDAADLLGVRMFETLAETWHGWGRSLGLPGVEPVPRRVVDVAILAATLPTPLIRLVTGRADLIDLVGLAVRVGTLVGTRTAYERNDVAYWLSPLADVAATASLGLGLLRRTQTWRGRTYTV